MIYVEYLHIATQKVYSCEKEYTTDTEMYWAFQQSTEPEKLGFRYERDNTTPIQSEPENI
jgi:hypothetical protein